MGDVLAVLLFVVGAILLAATVVLFSDWRDDR